MTQRIRTSSKTSENLDKIQNKLHLSSKAAILRICISASLQDQTDPLDYADYDSSTGFDISLNTLFGEYEDYYRSLIKYHSQKELSDNLFIKHLVSHIERGMIMVYGEFATSNSTEEMIEKLVKIK